MTIGDDFECLVIRDSTVGILDQLSINHLTKLLGGKASISAVSAEMTVLVAQVGDDELDMSGHNLETVAQTSYLLNVPGSFDGGVFVSHLLDPFLQDDSHLKFLLYECHIHTEDKDNYILLVPIEPL